LPKPNQVRRKHSLLIGFCAQFVQHGNSEPSIQNFGRFVR